MKYTISWQKKRMACSFKYHAWHKAVKKLWITYSITRKALGARDGGHCTRTRETERISVWCNGGTFSHMQPNACTGCYCQQTDRHKGVWTQSGEHWPVIRKYTEFRHYVLHRPLVSAAVAVLELSSLLASPKAFVPHQAVSLYSAEDDLHLRLNVQVNWESLKGWFSSCLALSCGPATCVALVWK